MRQATVKPTTVVSASGPRPSRRPADHDRGDDERGGQPGRHEDLGERDLPAGDRLDHQVDRRPVLDLGADRPGAADQGDQRHDQAHHERVEDAVGVGPAATDPDEQGDQDGEPSQEHEQDGPSPAEQPAQADLDDRHDGVHRRTR